jgi:hypothetical protein
MHASSRLLRDSIKINAKKRTPGVGREKQANERDKSAEKERGEQSTRNPTNHPSSTALSSFSLARALAAVSLSTLAPTPLTAMERVFEPHLRRKREGQKTPGGEKETRPRKGGRRRSKKKRKVRRPRRRKITFLFVLLLLLSLSPLFSRLA